MTISTVQANQKVRVLHESYDRVSHPADTNVMSKRLNGNSLRWLIIIAWCIGMAAAGAVPPATPTPATDSSAAPATQGVVSRFLPNPRGEIDGLLLSDGTQVLFPPHMTDELVAVVRPGDLIKVQAYRSLNLPLVIAAVITNVNSGQSVIEHPPVAPRPPKHMRDQTLQPLTAQGTVIRLLYGRRGETNGVVLSDGNIVRFPPHALYQFGTLLQPGAMISASGYGSVSSYGTALEATAMGAPGQPPQLLYRPPPKGRR